MDRTRIQELLRPFLPGPLTEKQLTDISTYIDLLLRWNAGINLTAVRDEESIVTRHFGESLFAARSLFPAAGGRQPATALADLGSGAGFPGLPIKIYAPEIHLTLIESNHKKATFLREVVRTLHLLHADVFPGRGEDFPSSTQLVTLRAVERFEQSLLTSARLVAHEGRIALLIGESQVDTARRLLPSFAWQPPIPIPESRTRVLAIGTKILTSGKGM